MSEFSRGENDSRQLLFHYASHNWLAVGCWDPEEGQVPPTLRIDIVSLSLSLPGLTGGRQIGEIQLPEIERTGVAVVTLNSWNAMHLFKVQLSWLIWKTASVSPTSSGTHTWNDLNRSHSNKTRPWFHLFLIARISWGNVSPETVFGKSCQ